MQDQVGIGGIRKPGILLRKFTNTRVISFPALQIFDHLEMQMGRPLPVLRRYAKLPDDIPSVYPLTFTQIFNGVQTEMAIECIKGYSIQPMSENNRCTIVTKIIIEPETMHYTI